MSQVTLTWAVNNMTRVINDGFVIVVDWSCTASATGVQGAFYGGQSNSCSDIIRFFMEALECSE